MVVFFSLLEHTGTQKITAHTMHITFNLNQNLRSMGSTWFQHAHTTLPIVLRTHAPAQGHKRPCKNRVNQKRWVVQPVLNLRNA